MINKAVIPAAGLGTRFLPITKNSPKEMLPLVDKPAIQYVVEEAVASGIDDLIIITGRGKRAIEAITMAYHRSHHVDTRIARIFNTFGPRMRLGDGRAVPNFIGQALRGEPITVYGDGIQTRSFCFISDLVEAIYRLMMSDYDLPMNLGNPAELTILEFAKLIKTLCESDSELVYERLPQDDPMQRRPDISKAKAILGWVPKVGLEEGLKRTIGYFSEE